MGNDQLSSSGLHFEAEEPCAEGSQETLRSNSGPRHLGPDSFTATALELSEQLIARAQEGGGDSVWNSINRRYEPALRVFAAYILGPQLRGKHTSEDLIQEAWMRILPRFQSFEYRGRGCLRRWLTQNMRWIAAEWGRGPEKRKNSEVSMDSKVPEPSTDDPTPSRSLESDESIQRLADSLESKQLASTYREIILAHCFEGRSVAEIAQARSMRPDTVRRQLHRAKERWKEILGDDPDRFL